MSHSHSDTETVFALKVLDTLKVERIVGKRILIEGGSPTVIAVSATNQEGIYVTSPDAAEAISDGTFTSATARATAASVINLEFPIIEEPPLIRVNKSRFSEAASAIIDRNPLLSADIPGPMFVRVLLKLLVAQ